MQPQHTVNEVLLEVLTIINYHNNKQKFIVDFEETNRKEALANLLERLPEETQKYLENVTDFADVKRYIDEETYRQELIKVSTQALLQLVQTISPVLSLHQKEKITSLITTA